MSGCEKKDEGPANQFTFDGKSYLLSQGFVTEGFERYEFIRYELDLASDGLTFIWSEEDTLSLKSIEGKGGILSFFFTTLSENGIPDGTYECSENWRKEEGKVFGTLYLGIGDEEDKDFDFTGGSVTVKSLGHLQYEITFEVDVEGGQKLKGYFKGSFRLSNGFV